MVAVIPYREHKYMSIQRSFSIKMATGKRYYFHNGWRFHAGDAFPIADAAKLCRDGAGRLFYEREYDDSDWESVVLPHTFNAGELFAERIKDNGSSQRRTAAFYRNTFTVPEEYRGFRVIFEFEGMRQTCYMYINGRLAGYYEAGTAPFGFDVTEYVDFYGENVVAVSTDNTTTREIPFCCAETPNKSDVEPGSYFFEQDEKVDEEHRGVGFFWNCNDFNPSLGGITRPLKLWFKPPVYLTLPLYSNLRTKGTYVYGRNYNFVNNTADIYTEAEIRNESGRTVKAYISVSVKKRDGKEICCFCSDEVSILSKKVENVLSIVPEDAYRAELTESGKKHYVPVNDEDAVKPTVTDSYDAEVICANANGVKLDFWRINNPVLYRVEISLYADGVLCDTETVETGFREFSYDRKDGFKVNNIPVWLRGYAQRASNEWAAIGIAPEWLKDEDAKLLRGSNANHIRWMHVAAAPADIRAADRHGIICTQPAGDKEHENSGRQWDQRVELMRDIIIAFRNNPSIAFWEAGNNSINAKHMREMRELKEKLDPYGSRFMGCRTLNTEQEVNESEYVGTMLNRHAAAFTAQHGPITETEYLREEAPRRVWDRFSPPDFDYKCRWIGKGGCKQPMLDFYNLTSEELALASARGYSEFFNDRIGGASGKNLYCACAALCWTDSAQHGRQAYSENARMSGRVDPARNKKQSYDVFRIMQSSEPEVCIFGHLNYPECTDHNYEYHERKFNGTYWEETGKILKRDPHNKTVYVFGSYYISRVELYINGKLNGVCDKPSDTFIFAFSGIDVTQKGEMKAVGFDYRENPVAEHIIRTAGEPSELRLIPHTAPGGAVADGNDVIVIDIEVTDSERNICPLCYERIDFCISGEGEFLGGYNSGKFGSESVIHKNYVYAECGTNRVFIRTSKIAGEIKLTACMNDYVSSSLVIKTTAVRNDKLTEREIPVIYEENVSDEEVFMPEPEADKAKYTPETEPYCKILVNGQEPDTRGVRSLNKNGRVWGAVICILARLKTETGSSFDYEYKDGTLTIISGKNRIKAVKGESHLFVNGEESLMDGEPYETPEGIFVMEVNAVIPYISGVKAVYDDKIEVLRIET